MRQRAAWRGRLDDPRTFLGWLLRDLGAPLRQVANWLAWALKAGALATLLSGRWIPALSLLALSALADDPSTLLLGLPYRPRALPVGPLLTLPPVTTAYPCRVEVLRRGTLLGRDVGVVTFVDGWLHYEGLRTSFSLCRADVSRQVEDRLDLAEGGEVAFAPEDLLVAGEHTEAGLAARFRANLKSWMRSDSPTGESFLPPAGAHPTGVVRAYGALATAALFGGLGAALALGHLLPLWAWIVVASLGSGFLRAARDAVRIRRLVRPSHARRPAVE